MASQAGAPKDWGDSLAIRLRFMDGTVSRLVEYKPHDTVGILARSIEEEYEIEVAKQRWALNELAILDFRPETNLDKPLGTWNPKKLEIIVLEVDSVADEVGEVHFHLVIQGGVHLIIASREDTIASISDQVAQEFSIPASHQRYLVPGLGMLQPDKTPDATVERWAGKRVKVMGTPAKDLAAFQSVEEATIRRLRARRQARRLARQSTAAMAHKTTRPASQYRFHEIRALTTLPNPERSQQLLERLAADRGIRAAMEKHQFEVGLLTEMEPLSNTSSSHEGTTRLLGLNHNHGQAIELRLRTDAYDGYRDYNTIRRTLCHELTHNVHGDHDRQFWDLCHQIEREVHATGAGHTAGAAEEGPYVPSPEEDVDDHGGLTGGTFVLGGGAGAVGLSRREILAEAAEKRRKETSEEGPDGGNQGPSGSGS